MSTRHCRPCFRHRRSAVFPTPLPASCHPRILHCPATTSKQTSSTPSTLRTSTQLQWSRHCCSRHRPRCFHRRIPRIQRSHRLHMMCRTHPTSPPHHPCSDIHIPPCMMTSIRPRRSNHRHHTPHPLHAFHLRKWDRRSIGHMLLKPSTSIRPPPQDSQRCIHLHQWCCRHRISRRLQAASPRM